MPQVIKVGPYVIFFWLDEGKPIEPIHVHIAEGIPRKSLAYTIWESSVGE